MPKPAGDIGVIHCNLGDVPLLVLLKKRCPNLRIEVILGKRMTLIALADLNLDHDELMKLNKDALPVFGDISGLNARGGTR